jgi:hypothetical protein
VLAPGAPNPAYGAIKLTAKARVDRTARTVYLADPRIASAHFPTAASAAPRYQQALQALLVKGPLTMSLDRLEAGLAAAGADAKARTVAVQNPVPQFVFSATPAVLVNIDGDPVWRPVPGTSYQRVVNTRPLLLRDAAGTVYFRLFDGFLQAPGLTGPWTEVAKPPSGLADAAGKLVKAGLVDPMEKPAAQKDAPPPPKTGKKPPKKIAAPTVVVATRPTELIVTDGPPDWVGVDGTQLLYVRNTDANVFTDMTNRQAYVLVSGRWFTAPGLDGPWKHVAGKDLPPTFAQMGDDSPKENVKASMPGTAQAKEALIASQIPQTATVDRAKAKFTPQLASAPEVKPLSGTQLNHVANSPIPIVQVQNGPWFALQKGIWFTAASLAGPWSVATSVPAAIYAIPPSSPLHYATYVHVYDSTPATVTVGYLPGYLGSYATAEGTVVNGTGYAYAPYIGSAGWVGGPPTYGYAAGLTWTPWTGWGIGLGLGWDYGNAWGLAPWGWSSAPHWGPFAGSGIWGAKGAYGAWGPQGWAAMSGNVYQQWSDSGAVARAPGGYSAWTGGAWSGQVAHSYNSQTGETAAGQHDTIDTVYAGGEARGARAPAGKAKTGARGAVGKAYASGAAGGERGEAGGKDAKPATAADNHYADPNGTVYRNSAGGWQQHDAGGGWSSATAESARALEVQQQARIQGDMRAAASAWGGGERGYGGGFRGRGDAVDAGSARGGAGR